MTTSQHSPVRVVVLVALLILLGLVSALLFYYYTQDTQPSPKIRIGYMNTWAEGALPIEVMKNTNILEQNNVTDEFYTFSYGPPIVEAALSGSVDAGLVGRVPAINLISKSDDWFIAARLAFLSLEIMARNDSGIKSIRDLKGKKIGVPFATGPYALVIMTLEEHGMDAEKDVFLINMKPTEMGVALKSREVDAVSWTEPSLTVFKQQGLAYTIQEYDEIGFVVISKKFAQANPLVVQGFLNALKESMLFISKNKDTVLDWFSQDAQLDPDVVKHLKLIEPNYDARNLEAVDLFVSDFWLNESQRRADGEQKLGIYDKKIVLSERMDFSYVP